MLCWQRAQSFGFGFTQSFGFGFARHTSQVIHYDGDVGEHPPELAMPKKAAAARCGLLLLLLMMMMMMTRRAAMLGRMLMLFQFTQRLRVRRRRL